MLSMVGILVLTILICVSSFLFDFDDTSKTCSMFLVVGLSIVTAYSVAYYNVVGFDMSLTILAVILWSINLLVLVAMLVKLVKQRKVR